MLAYILQKPERVFTRRCQQLSQPPPLYHDPTCTTTTTTMTMTTTTHTYFPYKRQPIHCCTSERALITHENNHAYLEKMARQPFSLLIGQRAEFNHRHDVSATFRSSGTHKRHSRDHIVRRGRRVLRYAEKSVESRYPPEDVAPDGGAVLLPWKWGT